MKIYRIISGILIAPAIFIIAWTVPYLDHSAFHKWIAINTVFAYITFLILASISHLVLKTLQWSTLVQYCLVMFIVGIVLYFAFGLWSLQSYSELYYSQTQVVENGSITTSGYLLKIKESIISGILSMVCMAVFWFIAIFKTPGAKYA